MPSLRITLLANGSDAEKETVFPERLGFRKNKVGGLVAGAAGERGG